MLFCELERSNRNYLGRLGCELCILLWNISKVIFKTDLSCLLSLVFVSLSLVFVHVLFSCFDLLFLLVLEFMLSSRIYLLPHQECLSLGIVRCQFLRMVLFVVLDLTFVLWYLSVAAMLRLIYSLTIQYRLSKVKTIPVRYSFSVFRKVQED